MENLEDSAARMECAKSDPTSVIIALIFAFILGVAIGAITRSSVLQPRFYLRTGDGTKIETIKTLEQCRHYQDELNQLRIVKLVDCVE